MQCTYVKGHTIGPGCIGCDVDEVGGRDPGIEDGMDEGIPKGGICGGGRCK